MTFTTSPFAAPQRAGHMYTKVSLDTAIAAASPHRLVAMLFEGLFESMAQARGAIRGGDVAAKGRAIGKAVSILEEGLKGGLNLVEGGTLAKDLNDLYVYAIMRLTEANLHSDEQRIEECIRILKPLKEAWDAIGPQVEAQAQAQPQSQPQRQI